MHDGLPPGLSPDQTVIGWEMALGKLAALVEADVARGDTGAASTNRA